MSFTEKQLRTAIAAKVETSSGSNRVYPFNCLNFRIDPKTGRADFSDWIALFSYTSGSTDYIHGWVIRRVGRETELVAGCEIFTATYEVFGFYEFTGGNSTTNSDDVFSAVVEAVAAEFNTGDGNGLLDVNGETVEHSGLQFPALTVLQAGEKLLHFAGGNITITYHT